MALTAAGGRLTAAHRVAQVQLATDVARVVAAAWPLLDLADLDASQRRWLAAVVPIVLDGRRRSANLAGAYLRAFAVAEGRTPPQVVALEVTDADRAATETSLLVTGPVTVKALTGHGVALRAAGSTALSKVLASTARRVEDGSRQTTTRTVQSDGEIRGYARVGSARACDFCSLLIGRGAVYGAESGQFASHDGCGCTAEPAYA
jgi:hypothetical protein